MGEKNMTPVNTTIIGLIIPFSGTALGAAMVFFLKNSMSEKLEKSLMGFAAGVMIAASVWSLLIPAMEMAREAGTPEWIPSAVGFAAGIGFLLLLDVIIPHLHLNADKAEGPKTKLRKTTMLVLAVTLHNIPEGMAVGVVFAAFLKGSATVTAAAAFALAIGIAIQNFPEGAIISMPLHSEGETKGRAFVLGVLSGAVEPAGAILTILLSSFITAMLPYFLSFAAGAMMYVVIEELIPEAQAGEHTNIGTIGAAAGFLLMMVLDVTLG